MDGELMRRGLQVEEMLIIQGIIDSAHCDNIWESGFQNAQEAIASNVLKFLSASKVSSIFCVGGQGTASKPGSAAKQDMSILSEDVRTDTKSSRESGEHIDMNEKIKHVKSSSIHEPVKPVKRKADIVAISPTSFSVRQGELAKNADHVYNNLIRPIAKRQHQSPVRVLEVVDVLQHAFVDVPALETLEEPSSTYVGESRFQACASWTCPPPNSIQPTHRFPLPLPACWAPSSAARSPIPPLLLRWAPLIHLSCRLPTAPAMADAKKTDALATPAPEPPEKPLPGDCCGSGCVRCVWDIYYDELQDYKEALAAHAAAADPSGDEKKTES
ncbi:hypothetical protein ZWY2020_036526 [Hordeum vulgare]|nr:hypothetical protein ZWY2020_036526 [Hordeum vulgare]